MTNILYIYEKKEKKELAILVQNKNNTFNFFAGFHIF